MNNLVKVEINNEIKEYEYGTSLLEISKDFKDKYDGDIILALVDCKLRELFKKVKRDCKIKFLTTKDTAGYKTYTRGLVLLMLKCFYAEIGRENVDKVIVEYSLGNGIYCDYISKVKLTNDHIDRIKKRMLDLVEKDIPYIKRNIGTDEAIELFREYGMYDKEKTFKYRRVSKANIYNLDGFEDYYYGYMPSSTAILRKFDLQLYKEGFVLILPNKKNPSLIDEFIPREKLFYTLKESNAWANMMGIDTVGALNDVIANNGFKELVLIQEALQEKKIGDIANMIKEAANKKFIMIAGPSSSGKTSFSHRLSIQLSTHGLKPHPIAVDNYFVDRELTPRDEKGDYNFESLKAIDIVKFNKDMLDLLNGKEVNIPVFNFITGKREYKNNYLKLNKDDILVIEGIHCLNDALSYSLPKESKFKIYISALTQLNIDEHNRIPTTDGRLIRRMVRDARTRGVTAKETMQMWPSVRRGEEENIFPFQEDADVMFNSALIYELSVLKQYAEPLLFGIEKGTKEYIEAKRLLKFFDYFIGSPADEVPKNSILKEFLGGSTFKV